MIAPHLGGREARLEVVVDLTAQCVAVQTPVGSPAGEREGGGGRADGALDAEDSLMSEGQDSVNSVTHRVVFGGTGIYRAAIGEVKQEILGRNNTGFLNFRFTFQIRTAE